MPMPRTGLFPLALCLGLAVAGCASSAAPSATDNGQASIEGTVVSIDTAPWTYDGNAVVVVDTASRGRVAVQLPARWNLCRAAPVDVEALAVGMRVRALGAMGAEGELVVCQDAAHTLAPAD